MIQKFYGINLVYNNKSKSAILQVTIINEYRDRYCRDNSNVRIVGRGNAMLVEVIEDNGKHRIETKGKTKLRLYVQPGTSTENRLAVLNGWYREQLKIKVDELVQHWSPVIKRSPNACGIRKMKTKWGSCNIEIKTYLA